MKGKSYMNRKIVLLMIPALMLSGCTLLDFNIESGDKVDPEDAAYRPTVVIREEEKGEEITLEQAEENVAEIKLATQNRSAKLQTEEGRQEILAESNKFSYDLKVKMDNYYVLDTVDFSKNDKYMHSSLHAEVPEIDLSKTGYTVDAVDIVDGKEDSDYHLYVNSENRVVEAVKTVGDGHFMEDGVRKEWHENSKYYRLADESVNYDNLFMTQLCNQILFVGNQSNSLMKAIEPYMDETYTNSTLGSSVSFHSKGEGHLYIEMSMPTTGLQMTMLFDNYWLTYEYMHIDLRKINELGVLEEELPYERMTTELSIDFSKANIDYPNLDEYTLK